MAKNMIKNHKAWLGALALFLMVGMATLTFAFKAEKQTTKVQDDSGVWYFNDSDPTDAGSYDRFQDTDNYTCGSSSSTVCKITVPAGKTLQDYLDENAGNLLAISDGRRESAP